MIMNRNLIDYYGVSNQQKALSFLSSPSSTRYCPSVHLLLPLKLWQLRVLYYNLYPKFGHC